MRPFYELSVITILLVATSATVSAQGPVPIGPAFEFTDYPQYDPDRPELTLGADGEFVIVWQSDGQDGDRLGVFSRRFDRRGDPIGAEFQVSEVSAGYQRAPRISAASSGEFVIVWQHSTYTFGYPDILNDWGRGQATPVGRRFERDGSPKDGNFEVSGDTTNFPSVAARDDGRFLVTWSDGSPYFDRNLYGQGYDAEGVKSGAQLVVDTSWNHPSGYGNVFRSDLALKSGGGFIVAFDTNGYQSDSSSDVTQFLDPRFQRFATDESPAAPTQTVDDTDCYECFGAQSPIRVDGDRFGNFVVVWNVNYVVSSRFQRYTADGEPAGAPGQLSGDTFSTIDVASNSAGDFVTVENAGLQAFDRLGQSQGPVQFLAALGDYKKVDFGDNGQIVVAGTSGARQYCWNTPAAISLTGNPLGHLYVTDVPDGTQPTSTALAEPGTLLEGSEISLTPAGRRALVTLARPLRRQVVVSSIELDTGLETARVELGPEARAVAGVDPLVTPDAARAALLTENPLEESVALRVLDVFSLSTGASGSIPDSRLVPYVQAQLFPDDDELLVALDDLAAGRGVLRVVDLTTGVAGPALELDAGERFVRGVPPVLISRGAEALTASQATGTGLVSVRLWDLSTGLPEWRLDFSPSESLVPEVGLLTTDDESTAILATSGEPGRLHVIDVATGVADSSVELSIPEYLVEGVGPALSADESRVVLSSQDGDADHAVLRVVELSPPTELAVLNLTGSLVRGVGPVATPQGFVALQATDGSEPALHRLDTELGSVTDTFSASSQEFLARGVGVSITPDSSKAVWPTGSGGVGSARVRIVNLELSGLSLPIELGPLQELVHGVDVELTRCGFTAVASTAGRDPGVEGRLTAVDLETATAGTLVHYEPGEEPRQGVRVAFPISLVREDCNANLLPDADEISGGQANDCNANGRPDECEPDCNGNGKGDECDISGGGSDDCDGDGIPDDCQPDCNANGVADTCDIASGTSPDICAGNGIPDECEPDCNSNGEIDSCDLWQRTSTDCNRDEIPDECQASGDADADGVTDCQDNCVFAPNPSQIDTDGDSHGDACDDDDDDDGVIDARDNCRTRRNTGQANSDGDLEGDACDLCPTAFDPATLDGDSDGVGDRCDCEPGDGDLWLAPSEVLGVSLDHDDTSGETTLTWPALVDLGGSAVTYDTLRSLVAGDFGPAATCLVSGSSATSSPDNGEPPLGEVFHYLIRAVNACPDGRGAGSLGDGQFGVPRAGRDCP